MHIIISKWLSPFIEYIEHPFFFFYALKNIIPSTRFKNLIKRQVKQHFVSPNRKYNSVYTRNKKNVQRIVSI